MLFLPFVTASCSSPVGGKITIDYSGWDSVVGTDPSVDGLDGLADAAGQAPPEDSTASQEMSTGLQRIDDARAFAGLAFLAVLVVGVVVLLLAGSSKARSIVAVATAAVAAGALVANHVLLRTFIRQSIEESAAQDPDTAELLPDINFAEAFSVDSRWGIWFTVAYLCLFAALNAAWLAYRLRSDRSDTLPEATATLPYRPTSAG